MVSKGGGVENGEIMRWWANGEQKLTICLKIEIKEISYKEGGDASPRHNCNGEILVRYGLSKGGQ